jgi:hypothetical protein
VNVDYGNGKSAACISIENNSVLLCWLVLAVEPMPLVIWIESPLPDIPKGEKSNGQPHKPIQKVLKGEHIPGK